MLSWDTLKRLQAEVKASRSPAQHGALRDGMRSPQSSPRHNPLTNEMREWSEEEVRDFLHGMGTSVDIPLTPKAADEGGDEWVPASPLLGRTSAPFPGPSIYTRDQRPRSTPDTNKRKQEKKVAGRGGDYGGSDVGSTSGSATPPRITLCLCCCILLSSAASVLMGTFLLQVLLVHKAYAIGSALESPHSPLPPVASTSPPPHLPPSPHLTFQYPHSYPSLMHRPQPPSPPPPRGCGVTLTDEQVQCYLTLNGDLQAAFGSDLDAVRCHWAQHGQHDPNWAVENDCSPLPSPLSPPALMGPLLRLPLTPPPQSLLPPGTPPLPPDTPPLPPLPPVAERVARLSASDVVNLVLDTDMSIDVDDVGAVCAMHALADLGEANILVRHILSYMQPRVKYMIPLRMSWGMSCGIFRNSAGDKLEGKLGIYFKPGMSCGIL